jgi:hypothetical protein
VNVCPPIVIVPLRASPTFAPYEKLTVPEPVPLPVTPVIQGVVVLAVHGHNAFDIVMPTLEEPAPAPTDVLDDASIAVHPLDWFTVNVWPPIVIVPERAGPVFAETV